MMLWEALAYLPMIFAVLILFSMLIAAMLMGLSDKKKARKEVGEFVAWMDTVDKTVGISELLKGKN